MTALNAMQCNTQYNAIHDLTRQCNVTMQCYKSRQDETKQDKTRQDNKTSQDRMRRDKTGQQDKTRHGIAGNTIFYNFIS